MLPVPFLGPLAPECVHEIPNGAHLSTQQGFVVVELAGKELSRHGPCAFNYTAKHGPAWKAWTEATSKTAVTSLRGNWMVPQAPSQASSQLLYLWNGVEPSDNSAVLQPVLQWGPSPAGGGAYWGLASWYVSSTHGSYHTSVMQVKTGDKLFGELSNTKGNTWFVNGGVKGGSKNVSFTRDVSTDPAYTFACNTLEMYSLSSCKDYPPDPCTFAGIDWKTKTEGETLIWTPKTQSPITCQEKATSTGADNTVIHWNGISSNLSMDA